MKRYRFRLEQVARVRRIQEEQARAELLVARQRLIDAGIDVARRHDTYEAHASQTGPVSTNSFRAQRHRHDGLAQALVAARVAEANAQLLVGRRVDEWTAAAREMSTMERLDERARAEHDAETDRAMQRELDDLITSRWSLKGDETP